MIKSISILATVASLLCAEKTPLELLKSVNGVERIEGYQKIEKRIYEADSDKDLAELQQLESELRKLKSDPDNWHLRVLATDLDDLILRKISKEPFPRSDSDYIVTYLKPGASNDAEKLQELQKASREFKNFKWKKLDIEKIKSETSSRGLIPVKYKNKNQFLVGWRADQQTLAIKNLILFDIETKTFTEVPVNEAAVKDLEMPSNKFERTPSLIQPDVLFKRDEKTKEATLN